MSSPHLDWAEIGGRPLDPTQRAHVEECPNCRTEASRSVVLTAALGSPMPVDLAARVQLAVATELAQRPLASPWQRTWIWAALLALVAALPGLMMPARDSASRPSWEGIVAVTLLLAASFAVKAGLAFRPGLRVRVALPLIMGVLAGALLIVIPGSRPEDPPGLHLGCLFTVVASSILPLAVLLIALRSEEMTRTRSVLAAAAAGALGEALVFRHCPLGAVEHILGAHLAGWVVVIALGFWLGELLRPSLWPARGRR